MKEKIAKMINVKSIISILLTIVFCYLSIVGVISGNDFITIFAVVISFYFGTQQNKNQEGK